MAKVLPGLLLMFLAITGCADKNDVTDRMMSYNQELSKDELENILTNEQVAVTLSVSED